MRNPPLRLTALACCALLALPPGWCCVLARGGCCDARPQPARAPGKPAKCGACPGDGHCPVKRESVPAPQPPREPAAPCRSACPFDQPKVPPKAEQPAVDLVALGIDAPVAPTAGRLAGPAAADVPPRPAYPPLHVLHCVWLC